jgi:hypothetical protein
LQHQASPHHLTSALSIRKSCRRRASLDFDAWTVRSEATIDIEFRELVPKEQDKKRREKAHGENVAPAAPLRTRPRGAERLGLVPFLILTSATFLQPSSAAMGAATTAARSFVFNPFQKKRIVVLSIVKIKCSVSSLAWSFYFKRFDAYSVRP